MVNERDKQVMGKSYNPFKMWGSWVGMVLGVSIWWLTFFNPIIYIIPKGSGGLTIILVYVLTLGFYFLLGWAIHSLTRRLRK